MGIIYGYYVCHILLFEQFFRLALGSLMSLESSKNLMYWDL